MRVLRNESVAPRVAGQSNVSLAPVAWDDTKALQDALRVSTAPPFRALLGRDTGIIVRDPSLSLVACALGSRWTYAILSSATPLLNGSNTVAVWSIHGPFDVAAWADIAAALRDHRPPPGTPTLIGADWNSVPNPLIDSLSGTPTKVPWDAPADALAATDTVDFFRLLRPDDVSWTFARTTTQPDGTPHVSARRLDSVWGSAALIPLVHGTNVVSTSSDHRAVGVSFLTLDSAQPAHSVTAYRPWSLHPGLWNEPGFQNALDHFARTYNPLVDLQPLPAMADWSLFHHTLRAFLRPLSRSLGSAQQAARHDLDQSRKELDALNLRDPLASQQLPSLLQRWHSALAAARSTETLRPGGHTTAAALRTGSWLFSSFASASSRSFPPLQTPKGLAVSPVAKLQALSAFYTSLFAARPLPAPTMTHPLLSAIRLRLDARSSRTVGQPFVLEDVRFAIKSANRHSSAGPDGIPYRVYLATFHAAGPRLLRLANSLGSGSPWPVSARTILLPKSGDPSNIANYRPITITNAYVRIISRMISARLLHVGDSLLPWTQSAFLPGRRSALVAGVLHVLNDLHTLPRSALSPPAMFVISLDQRKAYDRVLRSWLFAVLETINLPPLLLDLLRAIYSSPSTCISALGAYGHSIPLYTGVLQGDPSSCFLYNVSLQPLFDLLAFFNIGVPLPLLGILTSLAFADDSLLFLEASQRGLNQLHILLSCLDTYSAASGAAINVEKSSFWTIGTPPEQDAPAAMALSDALIAYGLSPAGPSGPSSHLGHPLPSRSASRQHPNPLFARLAAITRRAACFRTEGLDLCFRVANSNRFLGARLWHTISVGPLPRYFSQHYFAAVSPYLLGSRQTVSPRTLTRPVSLGGFGLIDPDAMACALSISFLRRYLLCADALGDWLRASITTYLSHRHSVPPAILLVRTGPAFGRLRSLATRSDGFLGRLVHALATVDLGLDDSWTSLPAAALHTLPWMWPWPVPSANPFCSKSKAQQLVSDNSLTWGDVLWFAAVPMERRTYPCSFPFGPPPGRSVTLNGIISPFSHSRHIRGPALNDAWPAIWQKTPATVRSTLSSWAPADISPVSLGPLYRRHAPSSHGWVPILQDPLAKSFPWHLLTVYGQSLSSVSTSLARRRLQAARGPRVPDWPNPPAPLQALSPSEWSRLWSITSRLPLPSGLRAATLLILNRHTWVHHVKGDPAAVPPTLPSRACPRGCAHDDGVTHGYFDCPAATEVWTACLPLLSLLGCPRPPSFAYSVLLRASFLPAALRPRFALWRSVVLHTLYTRRHQAGSTARHSKSPPSFFFLEHADVLSAATALLADCLTLAWERALRSSDATLDTAVTTFKKKWVVGGSFLTIVDNALHFAPVSASYTL